MSTLYPTSLDNFTNPSSTDMLNSTVVPHHKQHTDLNDAVESIETVLGLSPAGSHLTVKDRIIAAESAISGQSNINGLTDVTISLANPGDVLRYNGSVWVNYNEENVVDGGNF